MNEVSVKDVLLYLEESGWSELIDKRWEDKVRTEVLEKFPQINPKILDEALSIVLW